MDKLQQALKDLKEIHQPDAISAWPPAPGWWFLLIMLPLMFLLIRYFFKKRNTPKYKKLAFQELANIVVNYETQRNPHKTAGEIALLIRKALVTKYGNEKIASMIGVEWLAYLDKESDSKLFSCGAGQVLITAPYQKESDADINELIIATKKLLGKI